MKNRILALAVPLCLLALPIPSRSQGSASTPLKVGIINIQEAIASTGEGKKAFGEIQKKFQPRQQELQRQQQEIQGVQEQLQKQANTLSEEEQRRLSRELEEKQKLFKRSTEDADAEYRAEGQDVIQRIGRKMVPLINEYAQQGGYGVILDPAAAQVPVYYIAKEVDITEEIVKRYDAANPVEAAPTGAGSSAAPAGRPSLPASRPPAPAKPADKPKP